MIYKVLQNKAEFAAGWWIEVQLEQGTVALYPMETQQPLTLRRFGVADRESQVFTISRGRYQGCRCRLSSLISTQQPQHLSFAPLSDHNSRHYTARKTPGLSLAQIKNQAEEPRKNV